MTRRRRGCPRDRSRAQVVGGELALQLPFFFVAAKALAQHLYAASHGLKHYARTPAEYQAGIRTAVRLVCGRPGPAAGA